MASNIPVIVQGNSFSLAIPLQIYYINGGQMDLQDYTPDPTDEVSVQLKGSRRNYTYTPTIDGNVANIDLSGNELADNYSVVVSIVKANGQRLRSFRTDQFFIVESSDDLTTDDIIEGLEENVIYLNTSIFIAGADGRGIESIEKTGTSGLVDTYTITYTDATTSTFNVTNGANGQAGAQGADGVGITSIEKTGTSGLVDTYTITLSNGSTSTFEVTNGRDGHDLGLAVIVDDLTTGGHEDALSAEMGKVLNNKIDLLPTPNKNLNKRLFGTIGTSTGVFAKYIDIPRNLFNKYLYFWFTSGSYTGITGWNGGVTNGVVTRIDNADFNATLPLWSGDDAYRIQKVDLTDFAGYDYIRISLYQKDDTFINALFIGSDLDADYLSWEFVKLRQIPPVTSNWYSGESEEIKAVTKTRVKPSGVDYTRISTKNLFNPYDIVFYQKSFASPYYPQFESGFIPVDENTLYTASLKVQGTAVYTSFYNANKERIGTTNFARHTTPTGCAYIKFKLNSYNSGLENLEPDAGVQYEKGEKSYYEPYYLYDAKGMVSALAGKSFAFIGDSFTAPGTWCRKMCEILSATYSDNEAVSGGAWHGDDNLSAYSRAQVLVTYYNTIPSNQTTAPVKPDYILCVLGVNDVHNNATMGDVSYTDTIGTGGIDPSTFTGGVQATLKTLIDNFPNSVIKIGFTPGGMQYLEASSAMMARISPYIERLKFLADLYGVSYIETRATGMCRIVASEYEAFRKSATDPHPNEDGQNRIGEYMARILLSNL